MNSIPLMIGIFFYFFTTSKIMQNFIELLPINLYLMTIERLENLEIMVVVSSPCAFSRMLLQEVKQRLRCKFKYIANPNVMKPELEEENLDVVHPPPKLEDLKPR
jgi:hypothetical protein